MEILLSIIGNIYYNYEKKHEAFMKKKILFLFLLIIVLAFPLPQNQPDSPAPGSYLQTPGPQPKPTGFPVGKRVAFVPAAYNVYLTSPHFITRIKAFALNRILAAYSFDIYYDPAVIEVDTSRGFNGVTGSGVSLVAVNAGTAGHLLVSGFDMLGINPVPVLDMLQIHWTARAEGDTNLDLQITSLVDSRYNTIAAAAVNGFVGIFQALLGDVNRDAGIDMVDALMIAQYSIGLNPAGFQTGTGDVNNDNSIDIVDALLAARYHAGIIPDFDT